MLVFYKSKLAKVLTSFSNFNTIMFLGMCFTENKKLTKKEFMHENTHSHQYFDYFGLGSSITIVTMFTLLAFGIQSAWTLLLILLPISMFYILYGIEFIIRYIKLKDRVLAYRNISFERQARWISESWNKPCPKQFHYVSFGWVNFINSEE